MPFDMSMGEILVVLLVALLVFGGRLPDAAKRLGAALSEFKRGMREEMRKVEDGIRRDEPPPDWRPPPTPPREEKEEVVAPVADAPPAPPEGPAPAEPTPREP